MFKEQNERKENTVRIDFWTKHPHVPMSFDSYDQYLDFMSVWNGSWSSCDPGHMERTDFSDEDCFDGADSVDILGEPGADDVVDDTDSPEDSCDFGDDGDAEWFLEKDRSSALRRRSTALHKLHVQAIAEILSAKSNSKPDQDKVCQSPSVKIYKRVSFPRAQPVKLTTLDEELKALRQHLSKADFDEISCHFFYSYELEVGHLCSLERTISSKPNFGHAKSYVKYSELYSRKTHREKKRAKPQHVTLVFPYVSMAGLPFHH